MTLVYQNLIGRRFIHGEQDCYTLVQDFYRQNFGIKLTDYARPNNWWKQGLNLYIDNFEREGFRIVERIRDVVPADLFLVTIASTVANHAAVYLGDNQIIHHPFNQLSHVKVLTSGIRNNTMIIVRHKDVPDLSRPTEVLNIRERLLPSKRRLFDEVLRDRGTGTVRSDSE